VLAKTTRTSTVILPNTLSDFDHDAPRSADVIVNGTDGTINLYTTVQPGSPAFDEFRLHGSTTSVRISVDEGRVHNQSQRRSDSTRRTLVSFTWVNRCDRTFSPTMRFLRKRLTILPRRTGIGSVRASGLNRPFAWQPNSLAMELRYTPSLGFTGRDSFQYSVADSEPTQQFWQRFNIQTSQSFANPIFGTTSTTTARVSARTPC